MKKITLIAIIIFILVIGIIFIGDSLNTMQGVLSIQNLNTQNNNQILNTKSKVNTIRDTAGRKNYPPPTNFSNSKDINPPDINIDNLVFNLEQTSKDSFTINMVSAHNTYNDCYLIINNNVYDVSSYMDYHPAGSRIIISRCGGEVTGIFARIHSNRAWDLLSRYKIGTITTNTPDITLQILTAISDALKKANPDAEIIKISPKQNFYVAKIIYNGKLYEVHINRYGQIIKEEIEEDEANWTLWENDNDDSQRPLKN